MSEDLYYGQREIIAEGILLEDGRIILPSRINAIQYPSLNIVSEELGRREHDMPAQMIPGQGMMVPSRNNRYYSKEEELEVLNRQTIQLIKPEKFYLSPKYTKVRERKRCVEYIKGEHKPFQKNLLRNSHESLKSPITTKKKIPKSWAERRESIEEKTLDSLKPYSTNGKLDHKSVLRSAMKALENSGSKNFCCRDLSEEHTLLIKRLWTSANMKHLIGLADFDYKVTQKVSPETGILTNIYVCTHNGTCNKEFHRSRNLLDHCRVHGGVQPYSCPVWNKKFTQKGNLNKHVASHKYHTQ